LSSSILAKFYANLVEIGWILASNRISEKYSISVLYLFLVVCF